MSDLEFFVHVVVFGAYFALIAGAAILLIRRRPATEDRATGRHQPGRLRAFRRQAESAWRAGRRLAARLRRRLEATTWPVPVTAAPLVHGPAGMAS